MKLQEWLSEWLKICVKDNRKLRTYNHYKDTIDLHIVPVLGGLEMNQISYDKIVKFIFAEKATGNRKNGKELSSSSVNGILTILKIALNEAIEFGYLRENPCQRIKKQSGIEKQVEALTRDEQRKLEMYIIESKEEYFYGILISLYTGMRIGELMALRWDDVDLKNRIITVSKSIAYTKDDTNKYSKIIQIPKTKNSTRQIPISKSLYILLSSIDKSNCEYVVNKKKRPITIRGYQYIFQSILPKLKIQKYSFHSLRHTFATRALENGFDIKTLSQIMGHASATITMNLYVHSQNTQKVLMMEKLNFIYTKEIFK